jgi:hypothetical protein
MIGYLLIAAKRIDPGTNMLFEVSLTPGPLSIYKD